MNRHHQRHGRGALRGWPWWRQGRPRCAAQLRTRQPGGASSCGSSSFTSRSSQYFTAPFDESRTRSNPFAPPCVQRPSATAGKRGQSGRYQMTGIGPAIRLNSPTHPGLAAQDIAGNAR